MESSTRPAEETSRNGQPEKPTEPADYRRLNAVYGALLTGLIVASRERARDENPIPPAEMVPLGVATFALAKVIAKEKVATWVREPFVEQTADHKPKHPRGERLQHAIGELMTCTRCVGAWSALGLVGLRTLSPPAGRMVTNILVASAINDFMQAGFQLVTGKADGAQD